MSSVPDIKLIRTDTTLDLSQKAEKNKLSSARNYINFPSPPCYWPPSSTAKLRPCQRPPLDDAVVYEEVPLSEMEYEDDMNYY